MKYYIAYGSNLNKEQMAVRCPDAYPIGTGVINNAELVFRSNFRGCGVANVEPKKGSKVPIGIWAISDKDEKALDRYEGYPYLYDKETMMLNMDGDKVEAMIYLMNPGQMLTIPSLGYLNTIRKGYRDFGFPTKELYRRANAYD